MALDVDANGWPTVVAVTAKITTAILEGDLSASATADIPLTLAAVIAEFQAPQPIGTGRQWTPVTETRTFDGNGYPELTVPDIVPGSAVSVTIWTVPVTDVVLKTNYRGLGASVLARNSDGGFLFSADVPPTTFVIGHQNVHVTTTWGANVTTDIADAVACETARRILVANTGGTDGVGSTVKTEFDSVSTGGGALNLATSVLMEWGKRYRCLVESYGDSGEWRRKALVRRMS